MLCTNTYNCPDNGCNATYIGYTTFTLSQRVYQCKCNHAITLHLHEQHNEGTKNLFTDYSTSDQWAKNVRNLLNSQLGNRWIGRLGSIEWALPSPDLTIIIIKIIYRYSFIGFIYENI